MIDLNDLQKNIGKRIKIERIKRDLSQEDLAFKANVNLQTLGKVERGLGSSSILTLGKIANALRLSFAEIFDFNF